ncbi:cysteine desulfurase activator complex subunit SufD [Thiomicrorhabdus immobilis]|uniref:Cysteine desulfurase activator complex subunit SufD n=1 Tax=Thiomicrorhabdus immobilis TaxID=2791037 RepID=A0ABM7MEK8_9GAMM|nr:Fe-S cluster assembly protein SufD [Thiomicrorhabdus immobilis]BCN93855.1 cysteine desulfurase activator complex subunit SufD [Thiomicrorhabdus immobilis]
MQRKISPVAKQAVAHYIAESEKLNQTCDNPTLKQIRQQAQALLQQQAFPTQRDEDWQYTRLTGFVQNHFAVKQANKVTSEQVRQFMPDFAVTMVVFVDGWFNESLSDDLDALPKGLTFESLREAYDIAGDTEALFDREKHITKEPFGVLNSLLLADGFYLQVGANAYSDLPLFVLNIQTGSNHMCNVRNRIDLAENAELTLVERFVSLESLTESNQAASCTNVVTEVNMAKSARFKQVVMQEQSDNAFYFNNQFIYQADNSSCMTFYGSAGSQLSRHQNHIFMNGEHIESQQNSACLAKDKETVDSRTDTQHNDVWGNSQQLHKYVLTDQAVGVFNGMIRVDQKAQKTDGQMDNKNLLLSDSAKMDTKPQLEIYADDVKCSHGSASGQIDKNQIFYLQARGIRRADAIKMITHAFLLEPAEVIANDAIRHWVINRLSAGLASIQK